VRCTTGFGPFRFSGCFHRQPMGGAGGGKEAIVSHIAHPRVRPRLTSASDTADTDAEMNNCQH